MGIEISADTPIGSIIVGVAMLVFACVGWYAAWKGRRTANSTSHWLPVDAKILRARATQDSDGNWSPDIAYEYVIEGVCYESSRVRIFAANRASLTGARAAAHRYYATQRVTAYVNPADHSQAVLSPGPQTGFAVVVAVASLGIAASGVYFLFQGIRAY